MTPETEREKPVKSPCISICVLNEEDLCVGCFRTVEEICSWSSYSNSERREVLKRSLVRARKADAFL